VTTTIVFIALIGVGFAVWLKLKSGGKRSHFAELVSMCRGDRAQAQRLVDGQKGRHPGISDEEAARRAVVAWRREMR
jgi:hypothetical protein